MGILIGLAFGSGLLLILSSFSSHHGPFAGRSGRRPRVRSGRSASTLVVVSVGCAVAGGVLGLVITALPIVAVLAALTGALVPTLVRRRGEARRQRTVRAAWPDAVDTLASGVRAGLSLPEAVAAVATSGPEPLRPAFTAFAIEYRVTASFPRALDALRDTAPDAVAARVAAALDLAWGCGGTELGAVLRALSRMLREDSRVRAEIEARQSWTVAAARMAVAAPFVTLAVLALRPEAASAYATPAGAALIAAVGIASVLAYGLMRRIARLPGDDRRPA
jgi:tight adherence protein B